MGMAVALIVMGAVFQMFRSQQDMHTTQQELVRMQQNLRGTMLFMAREIRMAGCNPTGSVTPAPGFTEAKNNRLVFTMDIGNDDGERLPDGDISDADENVAYDLDTAAMELIRDAGEGQQPVGETIELLDFVYLDGSDPPEVLNPGRTNVTSQEDLERIRAVEITMIARSKRPQRNRSITKTYANQRGDTLLNVNGDPYLRLRLTTVVQCRNL